MNYFITDQFWFFKKACYNVHYLEDEREWFYPKQQKKRTSLHFVYYLSDRGMQHNYIVTFPTANIFYCKQLTLVSLADFKRLLIWYAKLQ